MSIHSQTHAHIHTLTHTHTHTHFPLQQALSLGVSLPVGRQRHTLALKHSVALAARQKDVILQ